MSTDFLIKGKIFKVLAFLFSVLFVFCSLVYAILIQKAEVEKVSKNFYFLVSNSMHVEASTHAALLNGGAGYVLESGNREYAAYAVYLKEADVEWAQSCMANAGENTRILVLKSGDLYFKGEREKLSKESILGAFSCFYDCISILEQEIGRLEGGATQQSSKRILNVLKRQFAYLALEYDKAFPWYSTACRSAENFLQESMESVVYVTDLRYLACELCFSYIELSENYSL